MFNGSRTYGWNKLILFLIVVSGLLIFSAYLYSDVKLSSTPGLADEILRGDWTDEKGNPVDLSAVSRYSEAGVPFVVTCPVPEDLPPGSAVSFRSNNLTLNVWVDEREVYRSDWKPNHVTGKSPGSVWYNLPIEEGDGGKDIRLEITTIFDDADTYITDLGIGSKDAVFFGFYRDYYFGFLICLLMLFIALNYICEVALQERHERNRSLLWLGVFSIVIALWSLTETQFLQLFTNKSDWVHYVNYVLQTLMIPVALHYAATAFGIKRKKLMRTVMSGAAAVFFICAVLHHTGVKDYHETMPLVHIVLAGGTLLFIFMLFDNIKAGRVTQNLKLIAFGYVVVTACSLIDLIRFEMGSVGDASAFIRIGALIFLVILGRVAYRNIKSAQKTNYQIELLSKYAYLDDLTRAGNNRSFREKMDHYEEIKESCGLVGIIEFDINNLKAINDTMGHRFGDELIVETTSFIRDAFGELDDCCRIGGDEFALIFSVGPDTKARAQKAVEHFYQLTAARNREKKGSYSLEIALGMAFYENGSGLTIPDVLHLADANMYREKKRMKNETI